LLESFAPFIIAGQLFLAYMFPLVQMQQSLSPSRLMVVMFTDVVGSTDRKSRFGTPAYAAVLARHDELFRRALSEAAGTGAEILQDTGDGHVASFPTASAAVRCALRFQHDLSTESWPDQPLKVRIGIHLGETADLASGQPGARPKLAGLTVDLAARLTALASGGQILLTRFPFNHARQFISEHPPVPGIVPALKWVAHGPYLFKGIDDATDVFEVGGEGIAPLTVPPDSDLGGVQPGRVARCHHVERPDGRDLGRRQRPAAAGAAVCGRTAGREVHAGWHAPGRGGAPADVCLDFDHRRGSLQGDRHGADAAPRTRLIGSGRTTDSTNRPRSRSALIPQYAVAGADCGR
jgi:class 3 adenylate cyclase